jgi:pyruvate/2-oxoglutarate dehydrogenase complex dihydrolipoamide dehydrogenase (E3) component
VRMRHHAFDVVTIGGGSAGLIAAAFAAGLGARAALVEKTQLGGECLWTGCVPSKALVHAAAVAHTIRHAAEAGIDTCAVGREQTHGTLRYVREARERVQEASASEQMLRSLGVEIFYADGRFRSRQEFECGDDLLRGRHFIVATGSRPRIPEIVGLSETGYLTNTTVFDLPEPPHSMVVLGGGPIGVEMAQAFARLGTRITLLQRGPRLLPRDDAELVEILEHRLREEGVDVRLGAEVSRVDRATGGIRVTVRTGGRDDAVTASALLVATGRRPNVDGLGLEEAGVATDQHGIRVDSRLRASAPNIWACGDVVGWPQFSHAAEYAAKVAVQNVLFPVRTRVHSERVPWTTFTDPELAHLGLTEADARGRGERIEVFRYPFSRDDRALVDGAPLGLVKLVAGPAVAGCWGRISWAPGRESLSRNLWWLWTAGCRSATWRTRSTCTRRSRWPFNGRRRHGGRPAGRAVSRGGYSRGTCIFGGGDRDGVTECLGGTSHASPKPLAAAQPIRPPRPARAQRSPIAVCLCCRRRRTLRPRRRPRPAALRSPSSRGTWAMAGASARARG